MIPEFKDNSLVSIKLLLRLPRYGFVNVIKNGAIPSKTLEFFKWAVASPFKLISTPFVYVIGKHAWDEMLRRSNKVIYPGAKERDLLARDARENVSRREDTYDEGKLGRLLDRIDGITRENSKIDVDIIGHSMGAIIANKMSVSYTHLTLPTNREV